LWTAVANVSGQASGPRIGDALSYTSQRRRPARKLQPIILFFIHPSPLNQSRTCPPRPSEIPEAPELNRRDAMAVQSP
jgi:hypothetical protein